MIKTRYNRIVLGCLALFIGFLLTSCSNNNPVDYIKSAGDYQVDVHITPNPPITGDNPVQITIRDPNQIPVIDARIDLLSYPQEPIAGVVTESIPAFYRNGRYRATLHYPLPGNWISEIRFQVNETTGKIPLELKVRGR